MDSSDQCRTMTSSGGWGVGVKQRPQIDYTEAQRALTWDRWKVGDTSHELCKLFDRPHTSVESILRAMGVVMTDQASIVLGLPSI